MFTAHDLTNEIRKQYERLKHHEVVPRSAVTAKVIAVLYQECNGTETYQAHCAWRHTTHQVSRFFNTKRAEILDAEQDPQLEFFDNIQRTYVVERNGEPSLVQTEKITDLELEAIAQTLEREVARKSHHAVCIRRLIQYRHRQRADETASLG